MNQSGAGECSPPPDSPRRWQQAGLPRPRARPRRARSTPATRIRQKLCTTPRARHANRASRRSRGTSRGRRGPAARKAHRGTQGPQGARGAQGSKGTQGAQGSQGSQGAQGRAGAPNAFTRTNKGSKVAIPESKSAVVASFAPGSSSHAYVIDATATVKQVGNNAGAVVCWDRDVEFGSVTQAQSVSFGFTGWKVPIATNGLLLAGPGNPIEELCRGYGTDASAHGEITVTQLSSGQTSAGTAGQLSARPGTTKPFRPRLRNSYVPPRKRGATFLPRGRAGTKP